MNKIKTAVITGLAALLISVPSGCGYSIYCQGVRIDKKTDYTTPALIGIAALATLYGVGENQGWWRDKDNRDVYSPPSGGDEGTGGPGGK